LATRPDVEKGVGRLDPRPGEIIRRDTQVSFSFEGRSYTAHPGDTIASALAAAGVRVFSRSFKYHRPRGLMCCAGYCPNCLVQVGEEPNVRACTRSVEADMKVQAQNVWPSLKRDAMSLTALVDRFLPVGFYYKTFIRPQFLWPLFERVLRAAAGLGKVRRETPAGSYNKEYLSTDVAVVGGGPAGMSAAIAAAERGARVLLFEENSWLGGHLRYSAGANEKANNATLTELEGDLTRHEGQVRIFKDACVLSWYEDNWLSAVQGTRLYKIRAQSVIFASGAYEQPLVFDNNDLPGVMLGSAVRRLLDLYAVAPGQKAVVVTANDDGWAVAADLQGAGLDVVAVTDLRAAGPDEIVEQVREAGADIYWRHTIIAAEGSDSVNGAIVAPLNEDRQVDKLASKSLDCDLVAVSVGWAPANGLIYQAGGQLAYDEIRAEFLPEALPDDVFVAGRVNGAQSVNNQLEEGRLAGQQAAAYLGFGPAPDSEDSAAVKAAIAAEAPATSTLVQVPGDKKRFLCFCEDVTDKDLEMSIAEGYNSVELLKRYSTVSMGPCQGKMCSLNTIHLCARANEWTIEQTGTTTARPPMKPIKLGALAGQHMEPVQVAPVHDWHLKRGAKMMVAGLWLRPEHYGDPISEVKAVRERVGLIDISTLGKLRLTGPGVPNLLDRLYVNKWQKLPIGRVRYGLMCNDEGIVLDDGVTAHTGEFEWYTTTTSSGATAIYEWIQWWLQSGWGDGVHLANVTEVNAAFNLAGPRSRDVLQKLTNEDVANEALPYMSVRDAALDGVPCRLMRIGFTGELSYEIHCPAGYGLSLWESLMTAGAEFDIVPFGVEAQRVLRLEKAHVIVGHDTDALSDPISADMAWAVKLDKPDFLGQRPLTRIAGEGPKQRLVGFKMLDPGNVPDEGLQIVNSRANGRPEIIGWVTSSRRSPTLEEVIGLCWLPADLADQEGAAFDIMSDGKLLEAQVHHGSFYDPAGERLRS
jgi:sarcosine oxidase subunit alpha